MRSNPVLDVKRGSETTEKGKGGIVRLVEDSTDVILTEAEHEAMVLQIKDYEALKDKLEAKRLAP